MSKRSQRAEARKANILSAVEQVGLASLLAAARDAYNSKAISLKSTAVKRTLRRAIQHAEVLLSGTAGRGSPMGPIKTAAHLRTLSTRYLGMVLPGGTPAKASKVTGDSTTTTVDITTITVDSL